MIGTIRRVWPGTARTNVIVTDSADQREKRCYVWMSTAKGQLIASLCERAGHGDAQRAPVVLTVQPPDALGWHQIEAAELMPNKPEDFETNSGYHDNTPLPEKDAF